MGRLDILGVARAKLYPQPDRPEHRKNCADDRGERRHHKEREAGSRSPGKAIENVEVISGQVQDLKKIIQ